VAWPQGGSCLR